SLKTKRSLNKRDVVINRLRDTDHTQGHSLTCCFLSDLLCPAERPIASDCKEDPDVQLCQSPDHLCRILGPPRGADNRAAALIDPFNAFGHQFQRFVPDPTHQALVAESEAVNLLDTVM